MHISTTWASSENIDDVVTDTLRELSHVWQERILSLYNDYLEGNSYCYGEFTPESLQVVPSSDLQVCIQRCDQHAAGAHAAGVDVSRISAPYSINIMGHLPNQHCVAFRGEARFLADFVVFSRETFDHGQFEVTFKPHQFRIPLFGLEKGLDYETFAGFAGVIDAIIWLKSDVKYDEEQNTDENTAQIDHNESETGVAELETLRIPETSPPQHQQQASLVSENLPIGPAKVYPPGSQDRFSDMEIFQLCAEQDHTGDRYGLRPRSERQSMSHANPSSKDEAGRKSPKLKNPVKRCGVAQPKQAKKVE